MHEYTRNNHYLFGFDGKDWALTSNEQQSPVYHWTIGAIKQKQSFFDSCIDAAKSIADTSKGRICVALSGGMDSELACRSLIHAGIDFYAAIVRFTNGSNHHDIRHGMDFCQKFNVKHEIIDIDIMEFMNAGMWKYIDEFHMISPQIPLQLWLLDQINDHMIFCGGDLRISRPLGQPDGYHIIVKPQTTTVHRAMISRNKTGCPYFFLQTPEQPWSLINDELTVMWLKHSFSMKQHSIKYFKPLIYEKHFPGLTPRQKKTGFEHMEELDISIRTRLENMYQERYHGDIRINLSEFNDLLEGRIQRIYRNKHG